MRRRQPEEHGYGDREVQLADRGAIHSAHRPSHPAPQRRHELHQSHQQRSRGREEQNGPELPEDEGERQREQSRAAVHHLARAFRPHHAGPRERLDEGKQQEKPGQAGGEGEPGIHNTCSTRNAL